MAVFPWAQEKAQKELDDVIGLTRLPTIDDIASLPYLQSVLMEVMRWSPTAPLGVAHRSMEEDVYDGYYIPAGTAVYSVRLCSWSWLSAHTSRRISGITLP